MSERMESQLRKELEKLSERELTNQSLEAICKLTKSLYYLIAIRSMEEGGYSEESYRDGGSYAYGRDGGYSERRRRDSRGRYTREGGGSNNSYARGRGGSRNYSREDYSRDEDAEMMDTLSEMMDRTNDPKEREALQKMMSQM